MPTLGILYGDTTKSLLKTIENSSINPYSEEEKFETERRIEELLKKRNDKNDHWEISTKG